MVISFPTRKISAFFLYFPKRCLIYSQSSGPLTILRGRHRAKTESDMYVNLFRRYRVNERPLESKDIYRVCLSLSFKPVNMNFLRTGETAKAVHRGSKVIHVENCQKRKELLPVLLFPPPAPDSAQQPHTSVTMGIWRGGKKLKASQPQKWGVRLRLCSLFLYLLNLLFKEK